MMQAGGSMLELDRVGNSYDGAPLLREVSFRLAKGEILCLLGPSGSGKTTLLRLIAGLEREETGRILYRGRDLRPLPPHKRDIGMMFQEYALFPHKNVGQNIAFGLEVKKLSAADQERKVEEMLELVGLAGYGDRKITELSGGERQRVALARSLAPEPELLLLDEPLGSLDRTLRDRLTGEIRSILKALGVTAVFVTHDQAEAFSIADKVAILHDGVLQQFDTPENIYYAPENSTVARFLGFANLIPGELGADGTFSSPLGEVPVSEPGAGSRPAAPGQALLLLRPDAARLAEAAAPPEAVLTGMVKSRMFLGASYRLLVEVGTLGLSFDLPLKPKPPGEGQTVRLAVDPGAAVLLRH